MGNTIIEQVFIRNVITTVLIVGALIGVFFFVRWAVKEAVIPKWSTLIYLFVSIIVTAIMCIGMLDIYLDINEESYVLYQGTYEERGGGQKSLKTIVVYDSDGNEIKLLRNGKSEEGRFFGMVKYGKRSKIVVEYEGQKLE